MQNDGLKLFVASSAEQDELAQLLEIAGVTDFIQKKTSSDDAKRSKPDPDIVQTTLEKMGYAPSEVVMLGDTPYDLQAAQKAGVPLIALRCGGWTDPDLAGAIAIYHDPADLLAHYDTSPLARAGKSNERSND
jgi:phosphoglycolate phosphatase-like HAD superfamily hydrolase